MTMMMMMTMGTQSGARLPTDDGAEHDDNDDDDNDNGYVDDDHP